MNEKVHLTPEQIAARNPSENFQDLLDKQQSDLTGQGFRVRHVPDDAERCRWTAQRIADGGVIG